MEILFLFLNIPGARWPPSLQMKFRRRTRGSFQRGKRRTLKLGLRGLRRVYIPHRLQTWRQSKPSRRLGSDAGLEGPWTFDLKVFLERLCGRLTKPWRRRRKWCWAGRGHELFVNIHSKLRELVCRRLITTSRLHRRPLATSGGSETCGMVALTFGRTGSRPSS